MGVSRAGRQHYHRHDVEVHLAAIHCEFDHRVFALGVLGFFFIKTIKALFFNPISVAIALIVGAFVIFWVERMHLRPRVKEVDDMTARDALMVGLAQAVSLIPGTSRAGATIIGGMLAGLSRKTATEFSFFLGDSDHVRRDVLRRVQASRFVADERFTDVRRGFC